MRFRVKIRARHPILDRIIVILVLLTILILLGKLALLIEQISNARKQSTLQYMLQVALQPVGTTMYIWGGGWDDEDQTAGTTSTQMGLSAQWENFAKQQNAAYDFNNHRLERENGLDCSGYVGWVMYNTFETESGREGYVVTSTDMAKNYADRGWGTYIENPTEFLVGDIVSMDGHVWISMGTCADGSVLLIHSSPPGVSVCGTVLEDGSESMAVKIATKYMTTYHATWQETYPNRSVSQEYLKNVSLMRWNSTTMSDAGNLQALSAEEILALLCSM